MPQLGYVLVQLAPGGVDELTKLGAPLKDLIIKSMLTILQQNWSRQADRRPSHDVNSYLLWSEF